MDIDWVQLPTFWLMTHDLHSCLVLTTFTITIRYTSCPEKNGADTIFAISSTNLDNFSQLLAQIILTIRVTEKL